MAVRRINDRLVFESERYGTLGKELNPPSRSGMHSDIGTEWFCSVGNFDELLLVF